MIMTDIKQWWADEHDYLLRMARAAKNPTAALFDMYERYDALTDSEKKEINALLIEWIEDTDEDNRYTSLAIVEEYNITEALSAMNRLCDRFKNSKIPDDPLKFYEREKVLRKIQKLERQQRPRGRST